MAKTGFDRFKIRSAGAKELLRSDRVRGDLERRAGKVRAAAAGSTDAHLIADSYTGRGRAGATVIGVPMRQEVKERILGRAIDAAAD